MRADSASGYFETALPRILAHRGLAMGAPENTLLAFLHALSNGATHLETDLHATLDGVAVLSHDPDLSRLVGRDLRIDQLTYTELKRIDIGEGQNVVSLREALDAFPEASFNLDVKAGAAVLPTAQAVLAAQAAGRVLIASFSEERRQETVSLVPGVATSASAGMLLKAIPAARSGLTGMVRRILSGVDAVQVPERTRGIRIVTPRFIRTMHDAGLEVHVWTVNDSPAMHRLLDLGVDGIVTDRCDLAAVVLEERRARL
ncbi:glycerophosphodiester phosphodiesterase family protein [Glaciibacter superstes]|uniref:glycerophosphodiester phosphodiesterase family protein n=1 Tax=Glaciibacter superstes TaxID=501023 RepID=UPI0003B5E568|nr:glycerophosphodiester phosphodiesterase family protein [Glaciibacter superstes]